MSEQKEPIRSTLDDFVDSQRASSIKNINDWLKIEFQHIIGQQAASIKPLKFRKSENEKD